MEHSVGRLAGANNNLDVGELCGADKNANMEHNSGKTGGANNNIDADLNTGESDKNIDIEHNTEIEGKVYKSNLFSLLLITIGDERQDCNVISPKHCPPKYCSSFNILYLVPKTTIT